MNDLEDEDHSYFTFLVVVSAICLVGVLAVLLFASGAV